MSRAKRKQKRTDKMIAEARERLARGRADEALARYDEAIDAIGRFAQEEPDALWPLQRLAIVFVEVGALYSHIGDDARALAVLAEAERTCGELEERTRADVRRLRAELKLRQGLAGFGLGCGASAVISLDEAVNLRLELLREERDENGPCALECASAMIVNARVLARFGDPHLAVISAEMGYRGYLGQLGAPGWDGYHCGEGAEVASALFARHGRLDRALAADEVVELAARERAAATGAPEDLRRLAAALTDRGLHLQATGRPVDRAEGEGLLRESRSLDADETREAAARWDRTQAAEPEPTLASALDTAVRTLGRDRVPADLPPEFTAPLDEMKVVSPAGRCPPELAAGYAVQLADVAGALLPLAAEDGLRIGLEAHFLFAAAWRADPPGADEVRDWEAPWVRLILECCRVLADAEPGRPLGFALALDLAAFSTVLIDRLLPSARAGGLIELLHDCLTEHAGLLERAENADRARELRDKAAALRR
ncbi:hypothetical protein E1200_24555 [Actinomadura sp. GC306]|uniref:hypothetical protein n=1 Tax=Actinomadura sp. GC306 TaxID=2530367 RepID=UPI001047ACFB|nr:hypothetical protein [Actinomadura sp. GC306]TDC62777.1 hypothetical protein E1200_24555 [Actinomadura sp. GC306]